MPTSVPLAPPGQDPLVRASPAADDVEARRARAAIESRLFSGPTERVTVGRYRVDGRLGSGGMGVVYRAHDPELARDVAVKLMNPEAVPDRSAQVARARLLQEARAMARLSHPNVIHVYDVGTVADGVFIAMELIDGPSLAKWLHTQPRRWTEVVEKFLQAGQGLAAAHRAGIVHRDFKPENVLLGVDGRVRVADFGLAGAKLEQHREPTPLEIESGSISIDGPLTKTGANLGTPKYMAPEQEGGGEADAASDQFGFCVALYEALYGQPPFEGETVATYRANVAREAIRRATSCEVPSRVHAAIVRGLRVDPAERHPDMDHLLAVLSRALDRAARRRLSWLPVLGLPLLVAGLLVASRSEAPPAPADPVRAWQWRLPELQEMPSLLRVDLRGDVDPGAPLRDAEQGEAARAMPPPRRLAGSTCYWEEDSWKRLAADRSAVHPKLVLREPSSDASRCFDCRRRARPHDIARLNLPEGTFCAQHFICAPQPLNRCQTPPLPSASTGPSAAPDR